MPAPQKHIPNGFVPAYLKIDPGDDVPCYFNPTEYSIAKTNTWNPKEVTGQSAPKLEFGGGQPRKMELSLLFDQTFPPYTMSVRDATALAARRDGRPGERRPPARPPPRRRSSRSAGARPSSRARARR